MATKISKHSNTISVIIIDKENAVIYIPLIRKWTTQSISEIKDKILSGDAVLTVEPSQNLQNLLNLRQYILDLESKGAQLNVVLNTSGYLEEIGLNMIDTLIQRDKQIEKDLEILWDLETRETEDAPE